MTRYEFSKLISMRALALRHGAPPMIDTDRTEPISIAMEELEKNAMPLNIRRELPDGTIETWKVNEMRLNDH
jgi:DNA-directed RNA polymerase subunit K